MQLSDFYEHGIARGVVRYAKSRPDWRLFGYGWMFRPLSGLAAWKGDGIIARVESSADADLLAALRLPLVDVAGAYLRPTFRSVTNDDFLTGYKAGLHLLDCGFARFAFLGVKGTEWSRKRLEGFRKAVGERFGRGRREEARAPVPVFERSLAWWEGSGGPREAEPGGSSAFGDFLRRLEPPAALFACNDTTGLRATELAGRLGIRVPDSLAILGVDDEDILCELASPSLSSVRLDCEAIGYRAAAALDGMLSGTGRGLRARAEEVPPKDIAERDSTRVFACPDELVSKAVGMIRLRAHEGLGVADLLEVLPASRRSLETRFRAAMGRSIHQEIVRAKLSRAKRLLGGSDMTVEDVAAESGFGGTQRFHEVFKAAEGLSPGAWRKRRLSPGAEGG